MDRYIQNQFRKGLDAPVATLLESMKYAIEGGKRIRAFLVMEGAVLAGEEPEQVLPTAAAAESFHTYSLIHDDLPSMDNALERRGLPSVHAKYGEATAILAGDSLLPLGFQWIGEDQREFSSADRVLKVVALYSRALGTEALTGGQYLDLLPADNFASHEEILKRKTASLIQASLLSGAILGGMSQTLLESLKEFGLKLGMAYQWMDDLLDWDEDPRPSKMGLQEVRGRAQSATRESLDALAAFGERAERLRELSRHLAERSQ
ncbi:polyprenyl synthetase family protein [Candidatus Acetothermia bacterium]|nr:polyprenyl synthetase family protein [Candidatus Acetothermia bacterium]MBI3643489.1 polyprenyl synthetase family protein [Candidatus Acetothermia bacterium]